MMFGRLLLACVMLTPADPVQVPEEAHFAETFDSDPLDRRWVQSKAVKETNAEALKYDGQWVVEEPAAAMYPGNRALVMKSSGRHHAIAAYLHTPFTFIHTPLCLQYEVMFGRDVECSGAYIKLLSQSHLLRLSQFSESTPYSVMFGPDKCGTSHRIHLIVRVTDSSNGRNQEIHAPQPADDLTVYFTDRQPHLYTLQLYQDSRYEIFIDQSLISQGRLLTGEVQYRESPDSQPESPVSGLGVGSVAALGLELWSLSGEVMFDNFLLTDDLKLAERWTQDTWGRKQPGRLERLLIATNSRPWLWGVYIFTVGLPIILFISYMWPDKRFGPPDQDYYYKKSDEPQLDRQPERDLPDRQPERDLPDRQPERDLPDRQPERDQPERPTSLSDYGAVSREGARKRETQKVQRKSDLEVENE
ncbi:calnexin isoform 1-T1 [Salvelinus alpinus]|uniref:calnexin isoform X2 n=1 Tax=Salvelinus alpinus TaxID=8036 RepID=UPI0039FBFDBC